MNIKKFIKEHTILLSIIMILFGITLKLLSDDISNKFWSDLLESFAILFISIFFVSIIYEKLLAERHFQQFKKILDYQLKEVDNLQNQCYKQGIKEIFKNRYDFEKKYHLLELADNTKEDGNVFVVARSMFHFFNKPEAIKKLLKKGCKLEIAFINPKSKNDKLDKIGHLKLSDIDSTLENIKTLVVWIEEQKPRGEIHVKTHDILLPDSFIYTEYNDSNIAFLDMSFGRDLMDKRIIGFNVEIGNLGNDLYQRYKDVWDFGESILVTNKNGKIVKNELHAL